MQLTSLGPPLAHSLSKRNPCVIFDGGGQMFPSLSHSGVPGYVLDVTADFTPLFVGLVVLLGLCALGIAFVIGMHDTREEKRQMHPEKEVLPTLPKAA